jgi:hypothetical protein
MTRLSYLLLAMFILAGSALAQTTRPSVTISPIFIQGGTVPPAELVPPEPTAANLNLTAPLPAPVLPEPTAASLNPATPLPEPVVAAPEDQVETADPSLAIIPLTGRATAGRLRLDATADPSLAIIPLVGRATANRQPQEESAESLAVIIPLFRPLAAGDSGPMFDEDGDTSALDAYQLGPFAGFDSNTVGVAVNPDGPMMRNGVRVARMGVGGPPVNGFGSASANGYGGSSLFIVGTTMYYGMGE